MNAYSKQSEFIFEEFKDKIKHKKQRPPFEEAFINIYVPVSSLSQSVYPEL